MTVSVARTVAVLAVVSTAAWEDGNGSGAHVVPARRVAVVLATGIYYLDDALGIRTIVWFDGCSRIGCQNGRRECEGVKIGTLGYISNQTNLFRLLVHGYVAYMTTYLRKRPGKRSTGWYRLSI